MINFAVRIIRFAESLPKTVAGKHIGGQIIRSGTSPAANYGEAQGAESRADFVHKMKICLKELRETRIWLLMIVRADLIKPASKLEPLMDENNELISIKLYNSIFVILRFVILRNMGKGAAVRTAVKHVTGDIVIIQEADLDDPRDYPDLIRPIVGGRADVVYGSRFLGGAHRVLFFWHYVGNRIITTFSNMLSNLNLTDMETGYKAFRRKVIQSLNLKANRFGFEPEVTMKLAKAKYRIYEVPISYWGWHYSEGKKITWKDGIAALFHIIRFRFFD